MQKNSKNKNQRTTNNNYFKPKGAPTAIGSLPFTNPNEAADLMLDNLAKIPAWPQLPKRNFKENMYVQYSEGFPAVELDEREEYIYFNTKNIERLEEFYQKYLDGDLNFFAISEDYAAGLHSFLKKVQKRVQPPEILKGQVTGPISFGLTLRDENNKAIIYNEQFADVIVKGLSQKARWQESVFKKRLPQSKTIIFFDEPYLVSFGSAFLALDEKKVLKFLNECFTAIEGLSGIHICGGTDWGLIMQTKVDIIHFDAYDFFESLTLYPKQLNNFLKRGGVIGWGITPHNSKKIELEDENSLLKKLSEEFAKIVDLGVDKKMLFEQSIIAPSCGAGSLSKIEAMKVLTLTKNVSELFRSRFFA